MRQTKKRSKPQLLQAVLDAFKQPDIRSKLLFTFFILVVFRVIAVITLPGVDQNALSDIYEQNSYLGILDIISGGSLRRMGIVALGVYPYITATIIIQVLTPVIPHLQQLSREGQSGRAKINQYTHWLTVPLALMSGYGQLVMIQQGNALTGIAPGDNLLAGENLLPILSMMFALTAGTMFLVWLGERISERGIGNGISMIIFANIVASVYPTFQQYSAVSNWGGLTAFLVIAAVIFFAVVIFTEAQRRIPVQYSKSVFRGGRMYKQGGSNFIPLRVNSAGMIPIIFSNAFYNLALVTARFH